ncbi:MAG: chemotaxis protein CheA [Firmicutes bacterium]|jgi:two-component system chemotaxis sensor kinase CheA|nr:chemotaxis protein CheA [Bacillota bacterium]
MEISDYLRVFMDECQEHLQSLNSALLELESHPGNAEILNSIFRSAHTVKGASATMGFNKMASVTHAMEDILGLLRRGDLEVTPEIINLLFDAVDVLEVLARGIPEGREADIEITGILQRLKEYSSSEQKTPTAKDRRRKLDLRYTKEEKEQIKERLTETKKLYHIHVFLKEDCLLKGARAFMILREVENMGEIAKTIPSAKELEDEQFRFDFIIGLLSEEPVEKVVAAIEKVLDVEKVEGTAVSIDEIPDERRGYGDFVLQEKKEADEPAQSRLGTTSLTVRVDIRKLDELMNLVAELVINRGRLEQISSELQNRELEESVETLNRLLLRLQDDVLQTRMVAVEHVFSRFPRLVRDLTRRAGKQVDLVITGADTELDRTVIDEIGDPLVHIIRNALDHGIEAPEERRAVGKPETGRLEVNAYQAGNQVIITVSDDGKGIDREKVARVALNKGYITEEKLAEMSEEEIINLLFLPGFSTSEKVTDVSGRGVGMDVVRERITALGGTVRVTSQRGEGTTVTIQLPLTLAIIQTLMIEVGSEIYAIPTTLVEQTISVNRNEIHRLHQQEVTTWRGEVLPLVRLQDVLEVEDAKNLEYDELDVVIVRNGERRLGCVVDTLLRPQDVVIKSLGDYLGSIPGIAGATILGDGRVALILDLRNVA